MLEIHSNVNGVKSVNVGDVILVDLGNKSNVGSFQFGHSELTCGKVSGVRSLVFLSLLLELSHGHVVGCNRSI